MPNDARQITINETVRTATGTVLTHKEIPAVLTVPNGMLIELSAIHMPELQDTLISLNDDIRARGPIVFMKEGDYVIPKRFFHILTLNDKVETCKAGMYVMK